MWNSLFLLFINWRTEPFSLSKRMEVYVKLSHPHLVCGEGNGTPLQYSCLANPMDRGAWKAAVHAVAKSWTRLSGFTFTFHSLEKEMATHSSVLAWRIPGTGEPGGLPSLGSHRVGHDWSYLAAAAAAGNGPGALQVFLNSLLIKSLTHGAYFIDEETESLAGEADWWFLEWRPF